MLHRTLALAAALTLFACASPPPAETPAPTSPTSSSAARVSGPEARKLVGQGAKLIDVRTPAEYAEKHLEGAVNVPLDTIAERDLGPKDGALVLYCQAGRRSEQAAATLRSRGYTRVYVLGPMSSWSE